MLNFLTTNHHIRIALPELNSIRKKSSHLWIVRHFIIRPFLGLGQFLDNKGGSLTGKFQVKLSLEIQFIGVEIVKQSQKYIYVAHALKHRFMSTARITKSLQLLEIRNIDVIVG